MRWTRGTRPRAGAPVPFWMILPLVFAALLATHWSLLWLPYFWDEAGYYIPAAWDFFRTGSLIPQTTLTNAHPPLPSVYLALTWKLFGFCPLVTRVATLLAASVALTAVWRLGERLVGVPAVAFWTMTLTAIYPVFFAQSSLAHADIFAAAFTLWGIVFALPGREGAPDSASSPWIAALCFAAAALAKETAIVVPITLGAASLLEGMWGSRSLRWAKIRETGWMAASLLPLIGWYAWHKHKTGFLFGNPEFLRYNAQANLEPLRFLAALGHRVLHLSLHMNLFVPVLLALAALLLPLQSDGKKGERAQIGASARMRIWCLLAANALFFSVLGGALLTRYLLPMFPLVLLLAVTSLQRHVKYWQGLAALSAAAFAVGLFVNPPYGFAPEDNLAYAHLVRLQQAGIAELNAHYLGTTVLSAWPLTDALTRPELGYLKEPYEVYAIDDFSAPQIARDAEEPDKYTMALVFSTKYDPQSPLFTLGAKSKAMDEKYFGLHRDLPPEAIARQLGGTMVWKKVDQGQWIALIRFRHLQFG